MSMFWPSSSDSFLHYQSPEFGALDVVLIRFINCHREELSTRWHRMHRIKATPNAPNSGDWSSLTKFSVSPSPRFLLRRGVRQGHRQHRQGERDQRRRRLHPYESIFTHFTINIVFICSESFSLNGQLQNTLHGQFGEALIFFWRFNELGYRIQSIPHIVSAVGPPKNWHYSR